MERSFVLVLTAVTLVTATPHGYGVKGGASAKAEASAVAGTFGDLRPIPLSIPSGAGYSGSFSKSSSSSFASSSASASSSSYSFSGSGANGIAGIGIDKGCSSGTCSGIGSTAPSSNGDLQLTGANAVSAAQAKALAGVYTPCQGSNCQNEFPSEKCTSGQCPTALKGQNECSTGNCQPSSPSTQSDSDTEGSSEKHRKDKQDDDFDGSNDFAVNFNRKPGSKPAGELSGQHSNKENPYDSISGCSNGKCGPTDSYHRNLGSHQNQQPAPSTYLTTPKEKPPCTTPNCNYPSQGFSLNGAPNSGLPSSYNVPLLSATNPPNTFYSSPIGSGKETTYPNTDNSAVAGGPCTSPNCNSTPYNIGASNIPNYNFGQQGSNNQGHCASGRCGISSPSNGKTLNNEPLPSVTAPNYSHGGIPSNVPSVLSGCKSPDCANLPTNSGSPMFQPNNGCNGVACGGTSPTGSGNRPYNSGTPVYSGGFGGSAGFLDKASGNSAYNHGQKINGGFGTTPSHGSFDHRATKPHELSPVSNGPTQLTTFNSPAGSFGLTPAGGTFGITNSNELNSNHGSTQSSSNSASTGVLGYSKPNSAPALPGSQLSHSNTGSYGATPGSLATPIGSTTHPENSGAYKPSSSYIDNNPSYPGSIDGSAQSSHANSGSNSNHGSFGITKPNVPSNYQSNTGYTGNIGGTTGTSGGSNPTFGSNGPHNKPSSNCGSGNCNIHPNANSGTDEEKPKYTGGFGGPTGLLKPNDYSVPSNTPIGSLGRTSCANGNCDPKSTPSSNLQSSLSNGHNLAAASAIASANAVAYSGGFGGPPGILKPYDDGKIHKPAHGNLASGPSPKFNTGNTDTSSVNGKNSEPGTSLPAVNPGAHASASASATAGSYSGDNNFQNHNGATRGCNSGCDANNGVDNLGIADGLAKNGAGAGSIATAKSSAGANAYGIGGSFSSASAHASAGAATKGGYGRK